MFNSELYGETYFEYGIESGVSLYTDYHWLPELTIPFCAELISQLEIKHVDTILDFGCAKGYMVKAFRLLGRKAFGVDISEYAVSCVPKEVKPFITLIRSFDEIPYPQNKYDWIIAKDVFEHIRYSDLKDLLRKLCSISRHLFAIIPLGDGHKFCSPREEEDVTHQIRESMDWWESRFREAGFMNLTAGYDLPHVLNGSCGKGWFICIGFRNW